MDTQGAGYGSFNCLGQGQASLLPRSMSRLLQSTDDNAFLKLHRSHHAVRHQVLTRRFAAP